MVILTLYRWSHEACHITNKNRQRNENNVRKYTSDLLDPDWGWCHVAGGLPRSVTEFCEAAQLVVDEVRIRVDLIELGSTGYGHEFAAT